MADLSLGEAARALGVSVDTLRRWDRDGKLETTRDERNRRRVPARRGRAPARPLRSATGPATRSRPATASPGSSRSVEVDGVMALVEIEAGPHRVTAAITRDAVEELGLAEGVRGDGAGQGDLGDGRARRGDGDARSAASCRLVALVLAATLAGCGGGLDSIGRAPAAAGSWSSPPPPRSSRRSPPTPTDAGIDAEAVLRRLRRPRRADPPGRHPGRLRGRQHQPARRALQGRPGRQAGRLRHQHAGARGAAGSRRSTRSTTWPSPDVTLAIGDEGVPVGDYTREVLDRLPARRARGDPRQRRAPRSPTSPGSSASSPRGRSTPASSTSPTWSPPTARSRRSTCRRACSPTSPTASRSSRARTNPGGAQEFIDGLLHGDGADGARATPASARRRRS